MWFIGAEVEQETSAPPPKLTDLNFEKLKWILPFNIIIEIS